MAAIECRALLGDKQAQEECTRQGIVLPCWRCGGEAEVKQVSNVGRPLYAVNCKKHYCGAYGCAHRTENEAISYWNTRPVPPLGRCKGCANTTPGEDLLNHKDVIVCTVYGCKVKEDGLCKEFEPKENTNG